MDNSMHARDLWAELHNEELTKRMSYLLADYYKKVKIAASAAKDVEDVKKEMEKAMGETEETHVSGFVITFKPNREIDADRLEKEIPAVFEACKGEAKFSVATFRKDYPAFVDTYECDSKKRYLRIQPTD